MFPSTTYSQTSRNRIYGESGDSRLNLRRFRTITAHSMARKRKQNPQRRYDASPRQHVAVPTANRHTNHEAIDTVPAKEKPMQSQTHDLQGNDRLRLEFIDPLFAIAIHIGVVEGLMKS